MAISESGTYTCPKCGEEILGARVHGVCPSKGPPPMTNEELQAENERLREELKHERIPPRQVADYGSPRDMYLDAIERVKRLEEQVAHLEYFRKLHQDELAIHVQKLDALTPPDKPVEQKIQLSPGKWVMRNGEIAMVDLCKDDLCIGRLPSGAVTGWGSAGNFWSDGRADELDIIAPYTEPVEPQSGDKELEERITRARIEGEIAGLDWARHQYTLSTMPHKAVIDRIAQLRSQLNA